MIKIFPLLIFPILFLIFFLNVDNLTLNLDNKVENETYKTKDFQENLVVNKPEKLETSEFKTIEDSKKIKTNESANLTNNISKEEGGDNLKKEPKNSLDEISPPEIKPKPQRFESKKQSIRIQFGAFSKIENAEEQKIKITKIISNNFPEFSKKFKLLEENNLYKLIFLADNKSSAKSICDYSKSKKISCLILKK